MAAGLGLVGAPATARPAAQRMPSATSLSYPPHLPSTRTGKILTPDAMPAIPMPLSDLAAMVPDTCVPCHELLLAPQPAK